MNRVCLVTGASRRVGRAIALAMAEAGFDIVVHYRSSEADAQAVAAECRERGVDAELVRGDLTRSVDIATMFLAVDARFERLDALINCAAVFRRTPPEALSEADFDSMIATNLKAPYLCSIEAASRMRRAGGGRIVNIADVAAERPMPNYVPYCVSKAGLLMLTRTMARAYAPDIQVNAVSPGTVLFRDDETEAMRTRVIARIPRGRIGTPEDVARSVVFLCTGPEHVTGTVLHVDGGRSLA